MIKRRRLVISEVTMDSKEDVFLQMNDLNNSLIDFKLLEYQSIIEVGVRYNKFKFEHYLDIDDTQY